ncbi:hypothetical protein LCGC14_3024410 [marine sediment metagenome]|uniref:Uncharacterized protein n=1 Tax=marine sediment metagenome TaxID=412755 RepID=A0A0F8Z204_9ZZZZ
MIWHKVTNGWVTQVYKDEVCVEQSFFPGDEVQYEDAEFDDPIDPPKNHQHQDFDMIQPYPGGSQNAPNVTL